jgi:glutamyl-tRNA synthetase
LRIEDTDKVRSKGEYLDEILGSLRWLFMDWDEEPVFQSKRFDIYKRYAEELVGKRLAYKEGEAVIFRVEKERSSSFDDLVHDRITVSTDEIKDQVLIKSDGTPTYNFACVIDDAEMKISHVIRGDDHISNTPKQILLYEALGLPAPKFAHIPLILSKDGGRLSKRHGATSIFEYRKMGFLPEALVNFLALMGWAPGDDKEVMPLEEIIRVFDVKDVKKTGAMFDMDKLRWINGQYLKNMPAEEAVSRSLGFLKERGVIGEDVDKEIWAKTVGIYKDRTRTLEDFVSIYNIFFGETIEYDEAAVEKYLKKPNSKDIIKHCVGILEKLGRFDSRSIEDSYRDLAKRLNVKAADLIHPTRVAISGRTVGAGLFEIMELLGRDKVLARLAKFC